MIETGFEATDKLDCFVREFGGLQGTFPLFGVANAVGAVDREQITAGAEFFETALVQKHPAFAGGRLMLHF